MALSEGIRTTFLTLERRHAHERSARIAVKHDHGALGDRQIGRHDAARRDQVDLIELLLGAERRGTGEQDREATPARFDMTHLPLVRLTRRPPGNAAGREDRCDFAGEDGLGPVGRPAQGAN